MGIGMVLESVSNVQCVTPLGGIIKLLYVYTEVDPEGD